MKTRLFQRLCTALVILALLITPLVGVQKAHAADVTLTVDGSQVFQTIDGFGVNANSASWNGTDLIPVVDSLIANGSTIWRVVIDNQDWEATNDDSDPNNYNWAAYNTMYSSPKFEKLWGMIAYLNSRGVKVILCPMGKAPNWMGGLMLTTTDTIKNEYAEMITSMAMYGHVQRGLQFTLEPNNEPDIETEGVRMSAPVQAEVLNKIAVRLDAAGLAAMRMMGPSAGVIQYAVVEFTDYMYNYPTLMAHVDAYSYHDYNGNTANADARIKSSAYPNKKFHMTEFSQFDDGMAMLGQGTQSLLVWDGYDSLYNHPLDRNGPTTAPNDAGDGPALLAYNSSNNTYTARKEFYQFAQLFKYVPAGSTRIGASSSNSGITSYAFRDQASSRFTIVGKNTSAGSHSLTISLNNIGVPPTTLSYFLTNSSNNMTQGADVSVVNGVATVTVPANTIFTLTGLGTPDTQAPSAPGNLTGNAASATTANLSWDAATDNTSVANYLVKRNGTIVGQPTTTSYSDVGLTAETAYTYTVQARDAAGNLSPDSNLVSVTTPAAPADTSAPTVAITAPTNGETVGGTVAVTATASDNTGVVGVQFKLDGVDLGSEDVVSPYSVNWDTTALSPGNHVLSAVARDAAGNLGTAANVIVTVNNTPGVVLLGEQTIQSNTDTDPAGTAEAFRYTATASGAAASLKLYVSSGTTATSVKVGVYSNNNGHPGTLLASGTINSPTIGAWNTASLSPSVTLTSGTTYWIGFLGTGGQLSYKDTASGNCSESPAGNLSALPTTWTTGSVWSSCNASAYVLSGASDATAPTVPANLTAGAPSTNQVNLSWDAATDNVGVTHYIVKRGATTIAQPTTTSFSDNTVAANTTYTYTVQAVDAAGNQSSASNTVTVTTPAPAPDTTPPTAPAGLNANGITSTSANLAWTAATDNIGVSGYQIVRDGDVIATTTALSYNDTSLTPGTTYSYVVTALDAAGNISAASNTVSVTTSTPDTVAPAISFGAPLANQTVSGTVAVSATASDNVGVAGVQFKVDGANVGAEDTAAPYGFSWNTATASNGVHTLTATARDSAGNMTTATVQVTVSNTAPSLALDKTVSTNQTSASATIASPSFSTVQPNELLVAFISSDGPSNSAQTYKTVTGGGLTWTLRKRVNTRAGTSEVWTAYATSTVSNAVVTATRSRTGYVGSITVAAFTGASSTIGAVGGNHAANGAPTVSLTTTAAGSLVWGVGNDWDGATARTVGANQTMVNQHLPSVGDTFWVQRANNPSTAIGQTVILNDTAPTNHRWNYASIEILPL
jgi:chitodextrinase